MFYVLICRECDDTLDMPFDSPEARGKWAAEHTRGTGHDRWFVCDVLDRSEVPALIAQHVETVAWLKGLTA